MAINKKLIHFKNKTDFNKEVANENILDHSIVFIQDSKEISTHGTVYKSVNWSVLEDLEIPGGITINTEGKSNGVYAITAKGELITYNDAAVDATCLGVALITDNQKIMIEKNDGKHVDGYSAGFVWGSYIYGIDVEDIRNTTNESDAKTDFNGKANTMAIYATYSEDVVMDNSIDMCYVLSTFNEMDENEDISFNDWYIPAFGQLWEIYTNKETINEVLSKINGTELTNSYLSSSEYDASYAWIINVSGSVEYIDKDNYYYGCKVRFVRDIN